MHVLDVKVSSVLSLSLSFSYFVRNRKKWKAKRENNEYIIEVEIELRIRETFHRGNHRTSHADSKYRFSAMRSCIIKGFAQQSRYGSTARLPRFFLKIFPRLRNNIYIYIYIYIAYIYVCTRRRVCRNVISRCCVFTSRDISSDRYPTDRTIL